MLSVGEDRSRGNARQKIFRDDCDYGRFLGNQEFVERIKRAVKSPKFQDEVPTARRIAAIPLHEVLKKTAAHYCVDTASFARKRSKARSRDVATWLARRSSNWSNRSAQDIPTVSAV